MAILVYKVLHLVGITMIVVPLGALALHVLNGGTRTSNQHRRLLAITHGIGLLLTLVAGFGMLARLGIDGFPSWAILKTIIWLVLGAALGLLYRVPATAKIVWMMIPLLVGAATWIVLNRGI